MNLVIFDLDNTLLKGDSDYNWALFLIKKGFIDKESYEQKNEQFYEDYQNGSLDVFKYCEFQFKVLKNNEREIIEQLREQYLQEVILPMIPDKAYELVEHHKRKNEKLLIITATNSFITKPIGKIFGIDDLIGTDPEELKGNFTGRVSGIPAFQDGKINRLLSWLSDRNLSMDSFEKIFFYSDSRNDIPLLEKVTNPVATNPDKILLAKAKDKGWPVINLW
tara:strand:- start:4022 stop:4684 length:663 start_codon:yes stop_codon:yes gene_type:complete